MTPPNDPTIDEYNALIEWYLLNRPEQVATIERLERQRDKYIAEIYPPQEAPKP